MDIIKNLKSNVNESTGKGNPGESAEVRDAADKFTNQVNKLLKASGYKVQAGSLITRDKGNKIGLTLVGISASNKLPNLSLEMTTSKVTYFEFTNPYKLTITNARSVNSAIKQLSDIQGIINTTNKLPKMWKNYLV